MRRVTIATSLRYASYGLALFSFVYIYRIAREAAFQPQYTARTYAIIAILGLAYTGFPFVSAYIWKLTVELVSRRSMGFGEAVSIYLKTNIAKYLPGNVMQYIGRNYLGARQGWLHAHLAFGSILELILLIAIPFGILAALRVSNLWTLPDSYSLQVKALSAARTVVIIGAVAVTAALASWVYLKRDAAWRQRLMRECDPRGRGAELGVAVLKIAALSALSMLSYTVLFYSVALNLGDIRFRGSDFINIACSLTLAGYAGILTPGVPGGIGVKESLSVILVSAYGYDKGSLVVISLFARAFSVFGDLMAFFIALRLRKDLSGHV